MENVVKDNPDNGKVLPKVSKLPYRKYGFFRDDQIVFLVSHPMERLDPTQLNSFRMAINGYLEKRNVGTISDEEGSIRAISIPTFTDEERDQCHHLLDNNEGVTLVDAFSIIMGKLTDAPENPAELLQKIMDLREDLKAPSEDDGEKDQKKDIPMIRVDEFDYDLRPGVSLAGITVQGASLNWLTSIASQGAGTGGPGGVPAPYYGSRKNAPYEFDLVRGLKDCEIYGNGDGVDIVILDTAPSAQDLVAAYKEWPDHPLIRTLLGPYGQLHLYPADYQETLRLANTSINGSDYKMTDHGLFIAGIIHSIVPRAQIHLVEVLNQYGVGDFQSLTDGLDLILHKIKKPGRKLIVNCSWMLDFPADDNHCHHSDNGAVLSDPDLEFERQVRTFVKSDQAFLRTMKSLFIRFSTHGRGAIAAAGNDAYDDDKQKDPAQKHIRPLARYPAALTEVTGVGALPITLDTDANGKYKTSDFSNQVDRPQKDGVATLGGEEGEGKGVLGLYIGAFPDGRLNTSKWAWWAGTSFATPIISGVFASLASGPRASATRQEAINVLRTSGFIPGETNIGELVIATTQC